MTTKRCPDCLSESAIRIIFYGLPMEEPDPATYTLGGCCIFDDMPKYECIECGWKGFKRKKRLQIQSSLPKLGTHTKNE
jgi:hypothetical protein